MTMLVQIVLTNAVMATLLAVVAALAGLLRLRPALVHGLWLLVLLKLVTPPFVSLPITWERDVPPAVATTTTRSAESVDVPEEWIDASAAVPVFIENVAPPAPRVEIQPEPTPRVLAPVAEKPERASLLPAFLLGGWAVGSGLLFLIALARTLRFRRFARAGEPAAPELAAHVQDLAKRLGLRYCPEVWLVPGAVSPMVWGVGRRARLLVPADLFARLDDDQRDALLLHELAHVRRGDHWVRPFELLVTVLFWWHPIVWWAREALHEAEEQCCDAWVVWALPGSARVYAEALLETVDFLAVAQPALPPAASGIGHVRKLKRRLTMIMQGNTPRTLSFAGFLGLFCLGVMLLPLLPQWVQADDDTPKVRAIVRLLGDDDDPAVREAIRELMERIENAKNEEQIRQAVAELTRRLQAQKGERKEREAKDEKRADEIARVKEEIERAQNEVREAHARLAEAYKKLAAVSGHKERMIFIDRIGEHKDFNREAIRKEIEAALKRGTLSREQAEEKFRWLEKQRMKVPPHIFVPKAPQPPKAPTPPQPPIGIKVPKVHVEVNRDRRLENLERQLTELMKQVEMLRKERKR